MDSPITSSFWLHDWHVDPTLGRITRGADCVQLGAQQVQVLLLLTRNPRQTLSQTQIEAAVWGDIPAVDGLYRCIAQLRAAFGDHAKQPRFIQTVPRQGYRLIAPVHYESAAPESELATSEPAIGPLSRMTLLARWDSLLLRVQWRERLRAAAWAVSAALILAAGMGWFAYERARAAQAAATAAQLSELMRAVFVTNDAPTMAGQADSAADSAAELLDRARRWLAEDLQTRPAVRKQMLEALGRSYLHREQAEPALPALEEAVRIQRDSGRPEQPAMALTLADLASALSSVNRVPEARHAYQEALDILRATQPQPSRDFAATFGRLGRLEIQRGDLAAGRQMLDASLQQMQEASGLYHSATAGVLIDVSHACQCLSDLDGAERALQQAQRIYELATPALSPARLAADNLAGEVLLQQQRFDAAALLLERTLAGRQQVFGAASLPVAETLNTLASVRNGQGRLQEAEQLKLVALDALDGLGESAKLQRASIQLSLATLLMRTRQFARSTQLLHEVIDFYDAALPAEHIARISAEHYLGEALLGQQQYAAAEAVLQTLLQRMQRANVPRWRISRSMSTLGEVLYRQGRIETARPLLLESYAQLASDPNAKPLARAQARQRIATLLGEPANWGSVLSRR